MLKLTPRDNNTSLPWAWEVSAHVVCFFPAGSRSPAPGQPGGQEPKAWDQGLGSGSFPWPVRGPWGCGSPWQLAGTAAALRLLQLAQGLKAMQ